MTRAPSRPPRPVLRPTLLLALLGLLAGCGNLGDVRDPIPTIVLPAREQGERPPLVVVLPGRRDNAASMADGGVAQAIQTAWPQAEVVLTSATLAYYLDGGLDRRLHEEVIVPAMAGGARELWLVGASLGGMGALVYDRAYPGQATGIVLLAPYLGEAALLREIQTAGGIAAWQPGPVAERLDRDNVQRELWRHIQGYADDPERGARVWLAYGDRDRLRRAVPVIAPVLVPDQVLERPGGHTWAVWNPALAEVLAAVSAQRAGQPAPAPQR